MFSFNYFQIYTYTLRNSNKMRLVLIKGKKTLILLLYFWGLDPNSPLNVTLPICALLRYIDNIILGKETLSVHTHMISRMKKEIRNTWDLLVPFSSFMLTSVSPCNALSSYTISSFIRIPSRPPTTLDSLTANPSARTSPKSTSATRQIRLAAQPDIQLTVECDKTCIFKMQCNP